MPPILAAALTVAFIVLLFAQDAARQKDVNRALWLPVLWLVITGSRFVSQWMYLGSSYTAATSEGSPIDAAYFLVLIVAGVIVLAQRQNVIGNVVRNNFWLLALFLYGFASILWSDFPFVALKRWIKTLGHPVMALIIITDPDPGRALRIVMKRCAYILLPVSVLFIKYFPEYGRGFDPWSGQGANRGVGLTKNDLGYICMVFGLCFLWSLITAAKLSDRVARLWESIVSVAFLMMVGWLLKMADSATSLMCFVLGATTLVMLGFRAVNKRFVGTYIVISVLIAFGLEMTFDIYAEVVHLLGRNPNLTDRTEVWAAAIAIQPNPIFGAGFESFWLGERLETLWARWWWRPTQAHNGYIETYLNLGLVGVILLIGLILATFRKICDQLSTDFEFARIRLSFLMAILAFSYTEAAFKGVHLVWTVFHIIAIDYPRRHTAVETAARKRTYPSVQRIANRQRIRGKNKGVV